MPGLLVRKTIVWHTVRLALAVTGILVAAVMLIVIGCVTFSIYVMTSTHHLLSLPGMAILACALSLLARDELAVLTDDFIWINVQVPTLKTCISGQYASESGWLVNAEGKHPLSGIRRVVRLLKGFKRPVRVMRVVANDGDVSFIGWDFRTMHIESDDNVVMSDGTRYSYVKHLFA